MKRNIHLTLLISLSYSNSSHTTYSWNIKWQKCADMGLNGFIFKKINGNLNIKTKQKKSWEPFRIVPSSPLETLVPSTLTNAESYMIPRHKIITFIRSLNNIVLFKKINLSEAIEKKKFKAISTLQKLRSTADCFPLESCYFLLHG